VKQSLVWEESIYYFIEVGLIDSWWRECFRELAQVKNGVWFRFEPRRSVRGYWRKMIKFKIVCEIMVKVEMEMLRSGKFRVYRNFY